MRQSARSSTTKTSHPWRMRLAVTLSWPDFARSVLPQPKEEAGTKQQINHIIQARPTWTPIIIRRRRSHLRPIDESKRLAFPYQCRSGVIEPIRIARKCHGKIGRRKSGRWCSAIAGNILWHEKDVTPKGPYISDHYTALENGGEYTYRGQIIDTRRSWIPFRRRSRYPKR